jgi:hypothetical protein
MVSEPVILDTIPVMVQGFDSETEERLNFGTIFIIPRCVYEVIK